MQASCLCFHRAPSKKALKNLFKQVKASNVLKICNSSEPKQVAHSLAYFHTARLRSLIKRPIPWRNKATQIPQEDQLHVNEAIKKFLAGEMIEVSPSQNRNFLSKFFTLQKKTKRRPILDFQKLNRFIQVEHLKTEGISVLREMIEDRWLSRY